MFHFHSLPRRPSLKNFRPFFYRLLLSDRVRNMTCETESTCKPRKKHYAWDWNLPANRVKAWDFLPHFLLRSYRSSYQHWVHWGSKAVSPVTRVTISYVADSFQPVLEYPPSSPPLASIKLKFRMSQVHQYFPLISRVAMLQNAKIGLVKFVTSWTTLSYPSSPALPLPKL